MKKIFPTRVLAGVAISFSVLSSAIADPITWNIENAKFSDGAFVTGSFTYDADTNVYNSLGISVSNGVLAAYTYTANDLAFPDLFSPPSSVFTNDFSRYINLAFVSPLSASGGTVALTPGYDPSGAGFFFGGGSYECDNCSVGRYIVSGDVTTNALATVPEPASLALLGGGLLGIAALRRKKKV